MSDIVVQSWPVEESVQGFEGAFNARVSCNGGVVVVVEDLGPKGSAGNADTVEVIQEEVVGGEGVMFEEGGGDAGFGWSALKSAQDGSKVGILGELLADLRSEFSRGRPGGDGGDGEVGATGNGVGYHILAAFEVEGLVFKTLEKEGPASGTTSKESLRLEMMEGSMIGVQGERATLEIDSPLGKSMDDSEEFLFIGGVIAFSWVHLLRGEYDRLESVALILL
jgi:hypothetical protein